MSAKGESQGSIPGGITFLSFFYDLQLFGCSLRVELHAMPALAARFYDNGACSIRDALIWASPLQRRSTNTRPNMR
jgi:hypothetical protein